MIPGASGLPKREKVFPLPVWPYANKHPLMPSKAFCKTGCPNRLYTISCKYVSSTSAGESKVASNVKATASRVLQQLSDCDPPKLARAETLVCCTDDVLPDAGGQPMVIV
jgi:hypothetical protein